MQNKRIVREKRLKKQGGIEFRPEKKEASGKIPVKRLKKEYNKKREKNKKNLKKK